MPIKLTSVGGGQITIDAPNTASNYTVTLPASNDTLLNTASTLDATKLSGLAPLASLTNATGRLIGTTYYTASGSYVKATNNPTFIIVEVQGGGAAGGAATAAGGAASGGGAGGYSRKKILFATLGATETVTVGTAAGTSSFGAHCSATGGTAGVAGVASQGKKGGAGGVGSGGDINLKGCPGENSVGASTAALACAGGGGLSHFGGNGGAPAGAAAVGEAATANSGSGGGGGAGVGGTAGAGSTGIVVVWEFA